MESVEDIVLRHSKRGMLKLREYMPKDFCHQAAEKILSWKKGNVFLTTGFYVAGYAETDGPAGTVVLARALKKLGFSPVILTDGFCRGFFESEEIKTVYVDNSVDRESLEEICSAYAPVGMIAIERCGRNTEGKYANMRDVDIGEYTAPIDLLFENQYGKLPTIGVGDGGNEIGMGNLSEVIGEKLELKACTVKTDNLVIASVSNWGAYGIVAALEELTGNRLLESSDWVERYINLTVELGSVDGVTHEHVAGVDGFDISIEKEIIDSLLRRVRG